MKKLTKEELANVSGGGHWEFMEVDRRDYGNYSESLMEWVWIKDNPDDPDKPNRDGGDIPFEDFSWVPID